ncbi:hypothetical protein Tco_1461188 [Tanacetum coccineum]
MFGSRRSRDMSNYCHFYEDHGHETNQCQELRHQIEEAVKSGQLAYLVKGIKNRKAKASDTQTRRMEERGKRHHTNQSLNPHDKQRKFCSKEEIYPKSVDGFEELSNKFLEEFSQQKRYDKDPTEIHGIKRKPNEGLQAFMDRFKAESAHIKGVPPVLRISTFMHGHGHPELSKKLNDKIPKMVDEMWERVRAFIRGEAAADTTEAIRSPRWEKSAGKAGWSEHQNGSRNRSHRRGKEETWGPVLPTLEEKASHL